MSEIDKAVDNIMEVFKPTAPAPRPLVTYGLPIVPRRKTAQPSTAYLAAEKVAKGREPGATIDYYSVDRAKGAGSRVSKQVRDAGWPITVSVRGSRVYITPNKPATKR